MLIGELSKKSGLTKDTIRYYEKMGILNNRVVQRNPENGYKHYSKEALEIIKMLAFGKQHGCTLNEIRELLDTHHENALTCFSIKPLILKKLNETKAKIQLLEQQKSNLEAALKDVNVCLDNPTMNIEVIKVENFR